MREELRVPRCTWSVRRPVSEPSAIPPYTGEIRDIPSNDLLSHFTSQASSSPIPTHMLQYPTCISSYFGITIETAIQGFSLSAQCGPMKERKWTGHWVDARARADNVHPCGLHFGRSTSVIVENTFFYFFLLFLLFSYFFYFFLLFLQKGYKKL